MPTDIAVHDTDQKKKNVMNSNPNCGNNRKERRMNVITKAMFVVVLALAGSLCAAETALIDTNTPWRFYLVTGPTVRWQNGEESVWPSKGGGKLYMGTGADSSPFDPATADLDKSGVLRRSPLVGRMFDVGPTAVLEKPDFSPRPPADWMKPAGDVSAWGLYLMGDLTEVFGVHGHISPQQAELLCLRTGFGVADPVKATDLKLTVTCIGGAVVYVNGKEIGRGFMPDGTIHPLTPATDLPIEAYTLPDGVTGLWPEAINATPENRARADRRIRTFTLDVPPSALVKGANDLAIEVHRAAVAGPMPKAEPRWEWQHLSVHDVRLVSASGAGAIAYAEAGRGTHLWSANPEQQVTPPPLPPRQMNFSGGQNAVIRGIAQGNPFDPLLPVRLALPRNGVGSGQVVLTDLEGLRDVSAKIGPLRGPAGVLPASAVEIRYAGPSPTAEATFFRGPKIRYCDALLPKPPTEAKTLPIWTIVQAPKDQSPGWYTGTLEIAANAKTFTVPLQVLVTAARVPEARDFTTPTGAAHSPESLAGYYKVKPWSAEHFRLMESSFRLMGQLGNCVVQVPVILGNMQPSLHQNATGVTTTEFQPLVRWVKTGDKLAPEFSLLEKYLDAYLKHCAPPKAISFYVWDMRYSKRPMEVHWTNGIPLAKKDFANPNVKVPLRVLQWDPVTDTTTPIPAPEFEDEGAAAFWRPLIDGLRAVVTKRGWSDRIIMLGQGGDVRPGAKTCELWREWAPYARWHFFSHFSGDSAPKDGKWIVKGGMELGLAVHPWVQTYPRRAEVLERQMATPNEFIEQATQRQSWWTDSPPLTFRQLPLLGELGRFGLDFWVTVPGVPGCETYLGGIDTLTVPGPDGPEPTVRFQMLREGVQDMEIRRMIIRALLAKPEDQRKPYRDLLDDHLRRSLWTGRRPGKFELQYDWRAYAAQLQQTAAELAGQPTQARWDTPPATGETR
jgi:hypothetical protein